MSKKVILAVFIVAITLGAEPEFKLRISLFSSATDSAFMPCDALRSHLDSFVKLLSSLYLFGP